MKSRLLVLMILIPLMSVPFTTAQIPTAAVSVVCDGNQITIEHVYDFNDTLEFSPSVINELNCVLSNPTSYIETVQITVVIPASNNLLSFDYEELQEIGGNSESDFTAQLNLFEGIESYFETGSIIQVDLTASVTEIQGLPPSNSATSQSSNEIYFQGLVNNSLIGLNSPELNGDYTTNGNWHNLNHEILFNAGQTTEATNLVWVNGSIDAPNTAGFTYEEWFALPDEQKLYENASSVPVRFHGNNLEFTAVTDQFGEFSQQLPAGMTFSINAAAPIASFSVGSLVTVVEDMAPLDVMILAPAVDVIGSVYLYDYSNKWDSNLFEFEPLNINAISDTGIIWETTIDQNGEFIFQLQPGLWSFDIEYYDVVSITDYSIDISESASDLEEVKLVMNSDYNAKIDVSLNPYIGIQFSDLDCETFNEEVSISEKQPNQDRKSLFLHWNNSQNEGWSHFSPYDENSDTSYAEEVDNGLIEIGLQFEMNPMLDKRLIMEEDGLFRGSFTITVGGDWTNDNDGQTACGQNDCEELNITLMAGPNEIGTHHETGLVAGENQVVFNLLVEEETIKDWDKADYNPVIKVEMKLRGNYQSGGIFFADSGEPASFSMKMGELSYLEFPISNKSFDCDDKAVEMKQWSEQFDHLNPTNQEPNVLFMTSMSNLNLQLSSRADIETHMQTREHNHLYVDDLENTNVGNWNIDDTPNYALIQPDGTVAWTSFGTSSRIAYSHVNNSVVVLQTCNDSCNLGDVIAELIDMSESEKDTDNDGVPDDADAFPNNPNESSDSDGDGVGDNSDLFPENPDETHDDDLDGVGNNTDEFPQDGNETSDDDGDGIGNNADAFPQDANETIDTDGDGVGDNADPEPENPDVRTPQDINVEISDQSSYLIAGAIVFLGIVILFVRRKQPPGVTTDTNFVEDDSIWNDS